MSDLNPSPEFEEKVRAAMQVSDANPEFVNKLRNDLARRPVKVKSSFFLRPAWSVAFVLALAILALSVPGVASALARLFGYVPNVGLVENTGDLRMLAEPASASRDGVTLTIDSVFVYEDRVELGYHVEGLAPSNDGALAEDAQSNPTAFCGGVNVGDAPSKNGNAVLRLPDGTVLERDATGKYPRNVFSMSPVYEASVPADVMELTFVLDCIPQARRGAVPENWELPIKLARVPAGTVVGQPATAVNVTSEPVATLPASTESAAPVFPAVTVKIERMVPMDEGYIFYLSMNVEQPNPSLVSIMPINVYAVDSLGQQIPLRGNFTWQPFEHRVGSAMEFMTTSKPADGPLTLVVERAVAYFAPLHVDVPQAKPEELTFSFDAGENPQPGQTWELDQQFDIAGYKLKVTSVRTATFDDIWTPQFVDGSQGYDFGYAFTVEADPAVKMLVEMSIISDQYSCWLSNAQSNVPESSSLVYIELCKDGYPKGVVTVNLWELAVFVENTWQVVWTSQ